MAPPPQEGPGGGGISTHTRTHKPTQHTHPLQHPTLHTSYWGKGKDGGSVCVTVCLCAGEFSGGLLGQCAVCQGLTYEGGACARVPCVGVCDCQCALACQSTVCVRKMVLCVSLLHLSHWVSVAVIVRQCVIE